MIERHATTGWRGLALAHNDLTASLRPDCNVLKFAQVSTIQGSYLLPYGRPQRSGNIADRVISPAPPSNVFEFFSIGKVSASFVQKCAQQLQTKEVVYNRVQTKYKRLSPFSNPKSEKGG